MRADHSCSKARKVEVCRREVEDDGFLINKHYSKSIAVRVRYYLS